MRINYKSDFDIILHLRDCKGDVVAFPDCDFDVRFWTQNKANAYTASRKGGVFTNCFADEGGIHFVFNSHRMGIGTLQWEPHFELPNDIYPDGIRDIFSKELLDVKLVDGPGDCGTTAQIEAMLPYIKFKYEDLTDAEKAELQQPATEAAQKLDTFVSAAEKAESQRVADEALRIEAEKARASQESERERAEATRQANEAERAEAEADREEAETERESAETARAEEFASWETELKSKADRSELSNVIAQEPLTPDNFPGINTYTREELKMDLFIDMWNQAWNVNGIVYGKYDTVNAPDAEHPFLGNKIWMTYGEAMDVYIHTAGRNAQAFEENVSSRYSISGARVLTNIPPAQFSNPSYNRSFFGCLNIKTIRLCGDNAYLHPKSVYQAFNSCHKLTQILGGIHCNGGSWIGTFYGCESLEEVRLYAVSGSVDFRGSPKLSYESVKCLVHNAQNTTAITITVHPDVYAKLTDESNAEWHQVLIDAAAKNITFATT